MTPSDRRRAEALAAALEAASGATAPQQPPADNDGDLAELIALAKRLQHDLPNLPAAETALPDPDTAFQRRLRAELLAAPAITSAAPAGSRRPWRNPFLAAAAAITALLLALAGINTGVGGWLPGALQHAASTTTPPTTSPPLAAALLRPTTATAGPAQAGHLSPGPSLPAPASKVTPLDHTITSPRPPGARMAKTAPTAPAGPPHATATPDVSIAASSAAVAPRPDAPRRIPTPRAHRAMGLAGGTAPLTTPVPGRRCPTATTSPTTTPTAVTGQGRPPPPTITPTATPGASLRSTAPRPPPCLPP